MTIIVHINSFNLEETLKEKKRHSRPLCVHVSITRMQSPLAV